MIEWGLDMDRDKVARELIKLAKSLAGHKASMRVAESWISAAARVIDEQGGFITTKDRKTLEKAFPKMRVLVRGNISRWLCPISDLDEVFARVEEDPDDYVRDVGLYFKDAKYFERTGQFPQASGVSKH
jgi:hypothetical protein